MFDAFFEMKQTPFMNSIDTSSLDMSPTLDETLSRIKYAADKQLFAVVTADVGCGKPTSVRKFTKDNQKTNLKYYICQIQNLHQDGSTKIYLSNLALNLSFIMEMLEDNCTNN